MVFCLYCSRKYKTKKAFKSHAESQSHKEKEREVRRDIKKFRQLFISNISSFIHRYDTHKDIEEVYKSYIKDNIISFRDVGYKDISGMIGDLKEVVDVVQKNGKYLVKGFDRFVPNKKKVEDKDSSSDELSTEFRNEYEEYSGDQENLVCYFKSSF